MQSSAHPKTLAISVGIFAYNEAKNIQDMLLSLLGQKTKRIYIEEIIVLSDGSTDGTDEIIKDFVSNHNIRHISQRQRQGKYNAVNRFIKLASADIVLHEKAIENLCSPFLSDRTIGITGARPIPKNHTSSFMGYVANLQWYLHHKISLIQPKFGELVAFRNIINKLPPTLVDEEQIAPTVKRKGYALKYIPQAIVYNKGPENIRDFRR